MVKYNGYIVHYRLSKAPKGVRYVSPKKPDVSPKKPDVVIDLDIAKPHSHTNPHPATPATITKDGPNLDKLLMEENLVNPKRIKIDLSPDRVHRPTNTKPGSPTSNIDNTKPLEKVDVITDSSFEIPPESSSCCVPALHITDPLHSEEALLLWVKMVGKQLSHDMKLYSNKEASASSAVIDTVVCSCCKEKSEQCLLHSGSAER